jgi:hypothetical protein
MPFESIAELRVYLLNASNDFFSIAVRDCAAKGRVEELSRMMTEVIGKRAQRSNREFAYQFGVGWPPGCAPDSRR